MWVYVLIVELRKEQKLSLRQPTCIDIESLCLAPSLNVRSILTKVPCYTLFFLELSKVAPTIYNNVNVNIFIKSDPMKNKITATSCYMHKNLGIHMISSFNGTADVYYHSDSVLCRRHICVYRRL
jgi:hypothetical protein